jgi:acetylornithine/succinyldiaminopimelate/putrescine aminotransferase
MNFAEIKLVEEKFQLATYTKMNIAVERGEGVWIYTSDGDKYLDLYGGHAVCATGHCHPCVVVALKKQADNLLFYSNLVYSQVRAEASQKIGNVAPDSVTKVFFCNSGTEANENAMRLARLTTGRKKIISFSGGFHGRTADSISATFLGKYRVLGEPNVPDHFAAEFGNIDSVSKIADLDTAAILIEPIQSMAGVEEATPEFFCELRALCDKLGIVLIFDEVQTGVGRCGSWFFSGSEMAGRVEADIITLAKSLGSGMPVGACLVSENIANCVETNDLGTTFGGGMMAMAAVLATIEAIEQDGLIENAKKVESYLRNRLNEFPEIITLRGKGCLLGIEFSDDCSAIHKSLLEKNIITGTSSNPKVLRLLPPLCVKKSELDLFLTALQQVICQTF